AALRFGFDSEIAVGGGTIRENGGAFFESVPPDRERGGGEMSWRAPFLFFAGLPRFAAVLAIRFYQVALSPLKVAITGQPGCCRFYPTCSQYALEAVRSRGLVAGVCLAFRRILKCHPFHAGGFDPVPPRSRETREGNLL